ncbi:MAG: PD-(D/E)XK motif protein [Phycisphaerales bacterium]|nr:PD-(D/E)XK motif protein [Phycisphaerales bacterium]
MEVGRVSLMGAETWQRLGTGQVRGDTLLVRRAAPGQLDRLFIGMDAQAQRHILIKLLDSDSDLDDQQTRGVRVITRELSGDGHEPGRYLDLACQDPSGHPAFDLIGGEIADRLLANNDAAPIAVSKVIGKWRRFWGQVPRSMLSTSEQLGLFAEMWFLKTWLATRVPFADALKRWRGPLGSRHDFEWQGRSVEVKATMSTRGAIHRINGVDQLEPPDRGELFLFSLRVREEAGAENTLPLLIRLCQQAVADDPDAASMLDSRLAQAGYSPAHDCEYAKLHLRVAGEGLYRVTTDFPRVVPSSFVAGVPEGVERIEYEVNLGAFNRLRVAERSSDPFVL